MASATRKIEFRISRFNPEVDKKPYMQTFFLEVAADQADIMLLKAILRLKDEQDSTISIRRSCAEGVCGSDGMNINGVNGLACITSLSSLKSPVILRALPGFPILRDLIVDMEPFYAQYERVEPWLQNDAELPAKERLQSPEEREKIDGLYDCILCGCCTSSCPSFWWNHGDADRFIGPAGLLAADRWLEDSRDAADAERLAELGDPDSLFACRTIMNCVNVCPKGLNPTKAIASIRSKLLAKRG